jgi:ubiquinone/menaquinone biosynthesis C-methylase UbiE
MVDQKDLHNKIYAGKHVIGHRKMKYVSEKFFHDLIKLADIKSDEKILDLGSGDGKFSNLFHKNTIATDIAKTAANLSRVPFVVADAASLPFKNAIFDKIFCSEVIEHFPDKSFVRKSIKEMYRILKPGGYAIISTPNENSLIGVLRYSVKGYKEPPGSVHTSLVSLHTLKKILKDEGFVIEKVKTYLLPLPIPKYDYNLPSGAMKILYHLGIFTPAIAHGIMTKVQKPQ